MGNKQSIRKAPPQETATTKHHVAVRSNRAVSYMHAAHTIHGADSQDDTNDVGCLIACKTARTMDCSICGLDLGLMADVFHAHRSAKRAPQVQEVQSHFCSKCEGVMCLECGAILNQVLQSLDESDLNACGGCTLTAKMVAMAKKKKDLLGKARRHDFCPRCNPILSRAYEEPFKRLIQRLVESIELTFQDDTDSSFVLVDVKQMPAQKRMEIIEAAAQQTPLLPLQAREKRRSELVEKLQMYLASEQPPADPLDIAGTWFALAESLPSIQQVSITPTLRVDRLYCYQSAVQLAPDSILFLCALLANMAKYHEFVVDGVTWTRSTVGQRVIALRKGNPVAWRNAALTAEKKHLIEVDGVQYTRNELLKKSIELDPDNQLGWYSAAYLMCPQDAKFLIRGDMRSRQEIFSIMLDDTNDSEETLEALVERMFGRSVLVFILSEVSLLCPDHPRVKQFAAKFKITPNSIIGMGAFGQVHRATRTCGSSVKEICAKVMTTTIVGEKDTFQSVPELYMLMSPLFAESIAPAHFIKLDRATSKTTIFMEYASFGSTYNYMKNTVKGRLHESTIRSILYQVLVSLRLLHYHGVVHQDIKPPNLLVYESMEVKLADFGVTCMTYCDLCDLQAGGTELYMPPEAYNDGTVSVAGDMWSLAATIVELASFHHPVPDPAFVRVAGARHPFRPYIPDHLSTELRAMLHKMLAYPRGERPSASELLEQAYFASVDLPPSAETPEMYAANKQLYGIPAKVRELEELSTLGVATRQWDTMTQGTMALGTMKQIKTQMMDDVAKAREVEQTIGALPNAVYRRDNGSLSPPIVERSSDDGAGTPVVEGYAGGSNDDVGPLCDGEVDNGDVIPSVSPVSPVAASS